MAKSNILNSKRVFLVLAGLAGLLYLPRVVHITAPYVQATLIVSIVFLILSSVLGISWSEKGLTTLASVVEDISRGPSTQPRDPGPPPGDLPQPPPG
jgi:hypothetical protein